LGSVSSTEVLLFGLRWIRLKARWRVQPRSDRTAIGRNGEKTACEIVFDRKSGMVAGMEFVGEIGSRVMGEVPSTIDLNLRALAYGGTGSSDISLISETARLGLG